MNNCCLITANRHQRQDQWASAERRWTCLWQRYPEIYHGEELLGHFKTQWMAWCGSQTEMIWDHGVVVWASSLKLKEDPSKQFSFSISSSKHDSTIFTHSFWVCSSWPMPLLFWPSVSHKRPNVISVQRCPDTQEASSGAAMKQVPFKYSWIQTKPGTWWDWLAAVENKMMNYQVKSWPFYYYYYYYWTVFGIE